jgi:hypothetical protein
VDRRAAGKGLALLHRSDQSLWSRSLAGAATACHTVREVLMMAMEPAWQPHLGHAEPLER